ncbi:hypothetical protein E2C01_066993 [Portunus trituberculatus]|uniref:Uncharacterized protein n=1 Tax=Portunus trituberculatus TaxID=210409 RepID=A0A5B7HIN2_PORTR|nr:hypothetical protein [Portunus trituberculatus]
MATLLGGEPLALSLSHFPVAKHGRLWGGSQVSSTTSLPSRTQKLSRTSSRVVSSARGPTLA